LLLEFEQIRVKYEELTIQQNINAEQGIYN